jgi:pimeloyl-ACP methyl ester carboxylesterase/DNA-binding CsgD family transcriptional regulator
MDKSPIDQTIGFTKGRDGVQLAYAVSGSGSPLVKTANWLTHIEYDCRSHFWRHWIEYLSSQAKLIRYDERGNGLSDHAVADLSFDRWVEDLETLVDDLRLDRFSLLGISQGGAVALEFAARHPDRVNRIVLCGAYAQGWARRGDESEVERSRALLNLVEKGWGEVNAAYMTIFAHLFAPDADADEVLSFTELQRHSTEPETAARLFASMGEIDVRASLAKVEAPTLVAHARQDDRVPFDQGRLLAASIPNARFLPLDSRNHALLAREPAWQTFKAEFHSFFAIDAASSSSRLSIKPRYDDLTERELAVAREVAAGLSNSEIGRRLGISEKTVRNHLTRVFDKLGVRTRAELIVHTRDGSGL